MLVTVVEFCITALFLFAVLITIAFPDDTKSNQLINFKAR